VRTLRMLALSLSLAEPRLGEVLACSLSWDELRERRRAYFGDLGGGLDVGNAARGAGPGLYTSATARKAGEKELERTLGTGAALRLGLALAVFLADYASAIWLGADQE
jgi:hypothetical protein